MNWQMEIEKMGNNDIEAKIEGILFASGEPVQISRLAEVLETGEGAVREAVLQLKSYYGFERRGIRLVMTENSVQLCSAPEYADLIRLALEKRKPPQLTQTALEVLAVIAYFQPVTRAYIESVRGVDSSYTVGILQERGLIEKTGTLQVPGRPALYSTTNLFLRTFGIESLDELPELPEVESDDESRQKIENAIAALSEREEGDNSREEEKVDVPEDKENPEGSEDSNPLEDSNHNNGALEDV